MVYWNHLPDHPYVILQPFAGPPLCNTVIIWRDPPPIRDYGKMVPHQNDHNDYKGKQGSTSASILVPLTNSAAEDGGG